jgi:hypothetical protein
MIFMNIKAELTKHRNDHVIYARRHNYWIRELCPLEEIENWDEENEEWTLQYRQVIFPAEGDPGNSLKAVCASTLTTRSRSRVSKIGDPSGERLFGPSMSKKYKVNG